jgi:hypothetical protein
MRVSFAAAAAVLTLAPAAGAGSAARFKGTISPLSPALRARMTGLSWHPGCPVSLSDLRLVTVTHWGFDGRVRSGVLVVHGGAAASVLRVMHTLYQSRFPIRRMRLVDDYGASDFASIEADNTSAFNCRRATGSARWSEHAYGRAIDVNPIENPYVSGGGTSHRASAPYLDRSRHRPGTAYEGGVLVSAFRSIGWGWGGGWSGTKDYQHFSASGS